LRILRQGSMVLQCRIEGFGLVWMAHNVTLTAGAWKV
jgi:hypothetical protein